ncbi:YfaZ precursor [Panacagrimonas perspica]|uniref:YfaZ n=1 Tax=Panacagrimonas perspica TaxID=381431 RepID=A0A4S3K8A8_9GAMM|nr:YfaZ family outer membrane protein [Panacagrimonas perspica]TDU31974.1 YfaZ precursor [Panacagrimonas perspica]THD04487.1 hypothetical protein B1810_05675 [Panacagrimonas perspica]
MAGLNVRFLAGLGLACLLASAPARAEVFDAAIGEDSLRLGVNGPLSRLFAVDKGEYDVGGVYGDIEDFDSEHFLSLHAGATLTGDAGATDGAKFSGGLGARLQYVNADHENGGALALGGNLRLKLLNADRLRFNANLWYGPDPASFGDIDEFIEYGVSIGYELLRDAEIYIGYRKIEVGIDGGPDVDLEDGAHIGIRLEF